MCGIPGSGKSSWALRQGVKVVSSDEVRRFVTGSYGDSAHDAFILELCHKIVRHYLEFGVDVIYDATNPTPESRQPWIRLALEIGSTVECIWYDTAIDICLERNKMRENIVPESVIRRIQGIFVPPLIAEGFDKVLHIQDCR
jgi:predicted kinase